MPSRPDMCATSDIAIRAAPANDHETPKIGAVSLPFLSPPQVTAHHRPDFFGSGEVSTYNEPTDDQLRDFFRDYPETAERFIVCPDIIQEMLSRFYDHVEKQASGYIYIEELHTIPPGLESIK